MGPRLGSFSLGRLARGQNGKEGGAQLGEDDDVRRGAIVWVNDLCYPGPDDLVLGADNFDVCLELALTLRGVGRRRGSGTNC